MIGPVPVAAIGLAGYLLIAGAVLVRGSGTESLGAFIGRAVYALAVLGTGFALYLTGIEVFVLRALCGWCLLSAAIITAVCALAALDLAG